MSCAACGARNAPTARFCDQCGTRLASDGAATPPVGAGTSRLPGRGLAEEDIASPGGDRRIVTALFADLVGYSRMVARLDPEDVRRAVDEAFGLLAATIDRYGGTLEKFIGDAIFAVFGAPIAHDDDALRAAHCALAMRADLAQLEPADGSEPLQLRIGIATGEVVAAPRTLAGQFGIAFTGTAVTTAARIQRLARPDEILVDGATVTAARSRLDVSARGRAILRGQTSSTQLHRLKGIRPEQTAARPRADRLVGRAAEEALLHGDLAQTVATGEGRAILIVGEAGMGKTRLAADLVSAATAAGLRSTWTENLSYRVGEPYGHARLFAERVADEQGTDPGTLVRLLLLSDETAPEEIGRMAGAIAAIARDAHFSGWEDEQRLAPTDPRELQTLLVQMADRYLRAVSKAFGPRIVVIDDLQWMDASSRPLTDQFLEIARELGFLLVVTSRPGDLPDWAHLPHVRVVELGGLDATSTEQLAESIAGADVDPSDAQVLRQRTAGNPLFIRETVRALIDDDPSAIRDGRLVLAAERPGALPLTLRAVLGARIDALPEPEREVLRVASVIGISFGVDLVEMLLEGHGLPADFERLTASGLVVNESPGAWRFAHPLIHDAAYAGLLASRRRSLHARLADRLETRIPAVPLGELAGHRLAAGDRERALPLLLRAAEEAIAVGAPIEAAGYLDAAAEVAVDEAVVADLRRRATELREAGLVTAGR